MVLDNYKRSLSLDLNQQVNFFVNQEDSGSDVLKIKALAYLRLNLCLLYFVAF